jgi:hypothetical protein
MNSLFHCAMPFLGDARVCFVFWRGAVLTLIGLQILVSHSLLGECLLQTTKATAKNRYENGCRFWFSNGSRLCVPIYRQLLYSYCDVDLCRTNCLI